MNPALVTGLCAVVLYTAVAVFVISRERVPHNGTWFSWNGVLSLLVTLPIVWLAAKCGRRLDPRRNRDMLLGVLGTATCVGLLAGGLVWIFTGG